MPPQIAAIVLAAGSSRRMGRPKQLLPLGPKAAIRHCIDNLMVAGVRDIVVVLGNDRGETTAAISGTPARSVVNANPSSDMAASVRIGLREVGPRVSGVLVLPADHPLVSPATIGRLVDLHDAAPGTIIIPAYRSRRGHPTLFPRQVINDIFSSATLREVIAVHNASVSIVETKDEGVVEDMDTPEDYDRIRQRFI